MAGGVRVVHVDDVPLERMQERDGWAISQFRLPISGADGSATTMFHATFRSGSTHARHVHHRCDELVAYLRGRGVVATGDGRTEVLPGHRRRIPQGAPHFYANHGSDEESLAVGFYVGAGSVADTGYEYLGDVEESDLRPPFNGISEGTLVRLDDAAAVDSSPFDAWSAARVRLSVGRATDSPNALLDAELPGGAGIAAHRLAGCEQLYYVVTGSAVVESGGEPTPVRPGSAIFVPRAEVFALRNTTDAPLAIVGVWTGAGSFEEAGYARA